MVLKYPCSRLILGNTAVENIYELVSLLGAFAPNTDYTPCSVAVGSKMFETLVDNIDLVNLISFTWCENKKLWPAQP